MTDMVIAISAGSGLDIVKIFRSQFMFFYNLKSQIGCVVCILFGISHLLSAANLSDFPVISLDEWQQHPIESKSGELNDIVFADDILVAAGKNGQFYTLQNETLTKIETPVSLELNAIYCISPSEIFIAGEEGCVLFYDGKAIEQIGKPVKTIALSRDRRDEDKWDAPVNLLYITANSKDGIFVAGTPSVLLHFDGSEWQHIDVGQKEFYIPDMTVIGHHYAYSSIGPIWQTFKDQIYVAKGDPPNIVDFNTNYRGRMMGMNHSHRPSEFPGILLRPSILCVKQVKPTRESFGMMGEAGYQKETNSKIEYNYSHTNIAFPIESSNNTELFIAPHIQKSKDKYYARFNNAIHHFSERGWNLSYKLPHLSDVKWSHWAINQNGDVLIQDPFHNYWMLNHEETWYQIESMPELLKRFVTMKITLNDKGHFAAIFPQGILTGKINLPKSN